MKISRGQIWWVDFSPSAKGSEITKRRPAVIISNDKANQYLNRVQIIPLTSNIEKCYPGEVIIETGSKKSRAMADQIQTFDKGRIVEYSGKVSPEDMKKIETAILIQLGIK